jgi:hypothetical protein
MHANHPTPVTVREFFTTVGKRFTIPVPTRSITYQEALEAASSPSFPFTARQLSFVALDHTYDSTYVWATTGLHPHAPFVDSPAITDWYRGLLSP